MTVSDLIAIAAVVIAGLSLVWSLHTGCQAARATKEATDVAKRQLDLQDRLTKIEQSREHARLMQSLQAVLRASLKPIERNSWRLVVINTGQGTARNVAITIDGKPFMEHPVALKDEQEIKVIGPESEISYCMGIHSTCHPPFELVATWDDDSGNQGQYSTTLTF